MNTSKYIVVLLLVVLGGTVTAQKKDTTVARNVTVEREYRPLIQDAGKVYSVPNVLVPSVKRAVPNYSDFNYPLVADFNIHVLPSAELQPDKKKEYKDGFATVGFGNYSNTYLQAALPLINKPDMLLDATLNHLGTFGDKLRSSTSAKLSFNKAFETSELFAGLGAGHDYYKYYGNSFLGDSVVKLTALQTTHGASAFIEKNGASLTPTAVQLKDLNIDSLNTCWRVQAYAGLRSLPAATGMRYTALVGYKSFSSRQSLAEQMIHAQANLSGDLEKNRWGLDVDAFNNSYNANSTLVQTTPRANLLLNLNPYYSIATTDWDIRLGVKSSFSFSEGAFFNPSLDVRAEWKVIPSYLAFYGAITGDYKLNSLYDSYSDNPYLAPEVKVQNTFSPSSFVLGLKLKPLYNLLIDAYLSNTIINNQHFYVNQQYSLVAPGVSDTTLYTNRFNVVYSEATVLKIGTRLSYNYRNKVSVELKGSYNNWQVATEQQAWNMPKWEGSMNAAVNINRYWTVSAQSYFEGERFAKVGSAALRMSPIIDINLGTSYVYNSWLTGFLKINNLINNKYQHFYGYQNQGFNVLVGATFSF